MNQSPRVTVKDVAKVAGVSPGTVSNALSGKRPVSEETRQRVLDAIAELGYRPNLLAPWIGQSPERHVGRGGRRA